MNNYDALVLICGMWFSYGVIRFAVSQAPGYRDGTPRWRVWQLDWDRTDVNHTRPHYLCGYHAASENRPGLSMIVDHTKCAYCREERNIGSNRWDPDDAA